ncbi:protein BatD [Phragmitibacter flavus]|uniref:Protein BatD n=1 Tax=Phragmitibacter flavus TaxID=2576071 RepID=A0A5R8KJJ0_9BACT|nr:BatD family protein [Phragmitibacter flavus]TLD72105.1 protein BatD [Phragmitibacter flavus]
MMSSSFLSKSSMTRRLLIRLAMVAVGVLLMLATSGETQAQRSSVNAQISPQKIRPGGFAVFSVTVDGGVASEMERPTLPEGVELANPGKSTSSGTTIINGRVSRSYTQSWQITAEKPGTYAIPPQTLEVNGAVASSNATELMVSEKNDAELSQYDPLLSIELEKREFYVGELVPITANLYVHRQTILRRVGLIELPKDNFAIQRFPLQGEEGVTHVAGVPYRVLTFKSTVSALKPGKFKLGPASSEVIVEMPTQENPFPHPIFSQSEPQKLRPPSNDIEVNVLALPEEGRPKGFTGVVGDFEMNMNAEPASLSVGEPIAVEITINGTGNFDSIVAPTLTESGAWKVYPSKRFNMGGTPDVMTGSSTNQVGFSQVIIPQKQVTEVPSYEFSFFSPTKKEYVTLRTSPLPLEVRPGLMGVPQGDGSTAGSTAPSEIQPEKVPQATLRMTDILSVSSESPVWLAAKPFPWRDPRFLTGSAVAGGVLALLLLAKGGAVLVQRSRNAADAPARLLWKQLKARQQPMGQFYHHAARWIEMKHLQGSEVDEVLAKDHQFNYSRDHDAAAVVVPEDERAKVLRVLREAEGAA